MNPQLVKHLIYPLHERLLGRATFSCLRELERSQWLDRSTLADLQREKLRRLLVHAERNCPFYRRRFAQAGLKPQSLNRIEDLWSLPILTKAQIRRHGAELTWPGVPGGPKRYTTGGSTGEPLVFYFDRRRQAYDQAARMRTHRWFGADVGQPEAYLWGSPIELTGQNRLRRYRDRLTNHLLLNAFDMSAPKTDQYLIRIERYQPVSLFGYPSSLALLARRGRATHRRLELPRLRAAFVTGEILTTEDRQTIEGFFGVPVADCYGSREAGFIAHECPQGRLHVTDENVVLELLDPNDQPVGPDEIGRVIITHLDTFAMPFIRYDTDDLARRAENSEPCPCGRGLSMIRAVEGRKTDFLVTGEGTVRHALSAIYVLRELEAIEKYRIVQAEDHSVNVEVVCRGGLTDRMERTIRGGLARALDPSPPIEIKEVPEIVPENSGKHRPVISRAALPGATS